MIELLDENGTCSVCLNEEVTLYTVQGGLPVCGECKGWVMWKGAMESTWRKAGLSDAEIREKFGQIIQGWWRT